MYIKPTISGYTSSGEQVARRQLFLILVQPMSGSELEHSPMRAIVRKVALHQFGPWMMGFARVKGERITISGAYGSDGLPCSVSDRVYDEAINLPQYLIDAWNKGGGWNSAGSEAESMRKWALENLETLYKPGGKYV